jgi:hypothetical protein
MKSKKLALTLLLLVSLSLLTPATQAQTLIFYQVNATDVAQVASGSVPNLGTLGNGTFGGVGIKLTNDIPVDGVPAGYGSAAMVCNGSGGVLAPGTRQLNRTNISNAGGFTYEAWFKWNGGGDVNAIIDYAGTEKLIRQTNQLGPQMETDNATLNLVGDAPSNEWHYVAVVFKSTSFNAGSDSVTGDYTFYLDTNTPAATVLNVTINSFGDSLNRTIGVGTHPVPTFTTDFFNGLIYEPRVTLGALTASQLLFRPTVMVTTTANTGAGSLRAAVASTTSPILVHFAPSLSGQTITLTTGPITCEGDNANIDASSLPGGITISGNNSSTIFSVQDTGQITNTVVALNSLNLTGGNDDNDSLYGGGAIFCDATMFVNNCTFSGNHADGSAGGGGAIYSFGTLAVVNNCAFNANHSSDGGAIDSSGPMALNNCTFLANHGGDGGAVASSYSLVVNNCTFVGNYGGTGGALWNDNKMFITNTILFSNTPSGSGPEIYSFGNSSPNPPSLVAQNCLFGPEGVNPAVSSTTPNYTVASSVDTIAVNAGLSPLISDGGPTQTMPPLVGSPAIDNGTDSVTNLLATDQRGFPRKAGAHVDIGAAEFQPSATNLTVAGTADSGLGSLRQAVLDIATYGSTRPITFVPALVGQTITLAGEIPINSSVTIDASGLAGGLTLSGGNQTRILSVLNGTTSLTNLVFTGGNGVGSLNSGYGGAINDQATLSATQCTFSNNSVSEGGGALEVYTGTAVLSQCTLSGNSAAAQGGAIENESGASLTMIECTMANNDGGGYGGAIENATSATANLSDCTVAGNSVSFGGGGIDNYQASLNFAGCIVAGNTDSSGNAPDLNENQGSGSKVTTSHDLIGNNTGSSLAATNGNLVGTSGSPINAMLAPLGPWGGPTLTMPPLPGSPAIDAGIYHGFNVDQRNSARFVGSNPDMGAVESGGLWVQTNFDTGSTSLRSVISFAEGVSGPYYKDVIFTPSLSGADVSLSSQLMVTGPYGIVIDATALPGGVQIDPGGHSRAFFITNGAYVILKSLNIINGLAPGGTFASGGGGGAIFCEGGLAVLDCFMMNNRASAFSSTIRAYAGAIANDGGIMALTNCTLEDNQAENLLAGGAVAGAFYNLSGIMTLDHCTVAGNTASTVVNGGFADGGDTFLHATAMDNGNTDFSNLQGGFSLGDNFISDGTSSGFTNGVNGDQLGTSADNLNALLASVGYHGGNTETMPPLPGSPLVQAGGPPDTATDQRGYPRLLELATDIGAVEGIDNGTVPGLITSVSRLGDGSIELVYTNYTDENFVVLAGTNATEPMSNWVQIGFTTESPLGSGLYQFTDPQAATLYPHRYYRVSNR